jgi:hypothetical protein
MPSDVHESRLNQRHSLPSAKYSFVASLKRRIADLNRAGAVPSAAVDDSSFQAHKEAISHDKSIEIDGGDTDGVRVAVTVKNAVNAIDPADALSDSGIREATTRENGLVKICKALKEIDVKEARFDNVHCATSRVKIT